MSGQPSDALDTYYYVLLLALDVLDGCYLAHLVVIFTSLPFLPGSWLTFGHLRIRLEVDTLGLLLHDPQSFIGQSVHTHEARVRFS